MPVLKLLQRVLQNFQPNVRIKRIYTASSLQSSWCLRKFLPQHGFAQVHESKVLLTQRNFIHLGTPLFTRKCYQDPKDLTRVATALSCTRLFHTTQPKRAIPPVLLVILRPLLNVAAVLFGRRFRNFWKTLPQEKKENILIKLRRNANKIYGAISLLGLLTLLFVVAHVEEVPFTKRKRFVLFSQEDMKGICDAVEKEILESFHTLCVSSSHHLYVPIHRVMYRIMAANRDDIAKSGVTDWKIYVIDAPSVSNAMVLPNGTVFVFSGLFHACSCDDQLGTVLAHEVAHVILNHQGEAFSKEHLVGFFFTGIIAAIWAVLPDFAAFVSHFFATKTATLLIHLPYSRLMESEADAVGLDLAAKACLDVREASVFWGKSALRSELGCSEEPFEFLSTHPSHENRQKAIDDLIPSALTLREYCKCPPVSRVDPRDKLAFRKRHLEEAKFKGCFSCDSIFNV